MDTITLRDVRAYGRHGAHPGERDHEQPFDISVTFEADLRAAQRSDELVDTIDYGNIHRMFIEIVERRSYALLERLAGDLLDALFADARIARAKITLAKPKILAGATPAVTLMRENPGYRACP